MTAKSSLVKMIRLKNKLWYHNIASQEKTYNSILENGCGAVDRVVTSETRGTQVQIQSVIANFEWPFTYC